jgi:hypothetical protein
MREYIELDRMEKDLAAMLKAVDPNGDLDERALWASLLAAHNKVSRLID